MLKNIVPSIMTLYTRACAHEMFAYIMKTYAMYVCAGEILRDELATITYVIFFPPGNNHVGIIVRNIDRRYATITRVRCIWMHQLSPTISSVVRRVNV